MYHGSEKTRPEEAIHQKPGRSIFRATELGPERVHCTTESRQGEKGKIDVAQGLVAVEGEMDPGHACAPHDEHDAEVVQLVPAFVKGRAVVGEGVVEG